jgi:hypothetical protein
VDLDVVRPSENVLLRGLGLNFFDYMALLTVGRGGVVRGRHGLKYRPSGQEPRLFASSRRGVPYHARGENEKGAHGRHTPVLLTAEYAAGLRERARSGRQVRFATDLRPLIAREVESVYYGTLIARTTPGGERDSFTKAYLTMDQKEHRARLLDSYGIDRQLRWSWCRLAEPTAGRQFDGPEDYRSWLLDYLEADVREAREGNLASPLKAALDALRDLRDEIRLAVDHGCLDGRSHRDELDDWYTPLNAFLSIGPPVSRIEEMALLRCGVLTLTGRGTEIRIDPGTRTFAVSSLSVKGPPIHATALVEARLPEPDLRRTADPLMAQLLGSGQASTFRIRSLAGDDYETGGLSVTERPQ